MTAYIAVRYEDHARGRVAFVAVDNQKKLNSLSSRVMAEFVAVFQGLAADLTLRAVVLTGAGDKAFIGGANIDELAAVTSPAQGRAFILKVHGCCQAVRDLGVPQQAERAGHRRRESGTPFRRKRHRLVGEHEFQRRY